MKTQHLSWKRLLAMILALILVVQIMPMNALATELQDADVIEDRISTDETVDDIEDLDTEKTILAEDIDKRESDVKHFLNTDGTYTAVRYSHPVHYKEAGSDQWIDIDNTLSIAKRADTNTDMYAPADSPLDVKFKKMYSGGSVVFSSGSHTLSWYYDIPNASIDPPAVEERQAQDTADGDTEHSAISENAVSAADDNASVASPSTRRITAHKLEQFNISDNAKTGNAKFTELDKIADGIVYNNIYPNVDLEYILDSVYLKENIVLKNNSARSEYIIVYNIGTLIAEQISDKEINLKTADGESIFTISAPYMIDANDEISEDVELSIISQSEGTLRVGLSADREWLKAEDRAYPVKIDPYVMEAVRSFDQDATAIYKSASYPYGTLVVGNDNGASYGKTKTYVKFTLPTLAAGDMVTGAYLNLAKLDGTYGYQHVGNPTLKINAYKVTSSWSESAIKSSTSYSGLPSMDSNIIDYQDVGAQANISWVTFNISKAAKAWYDGEANYGICLRANDESAWAIAKFIASNNPSYSNGRPTLQVNYRNSKGLESYWTTHSHSAGESGTGYVNDYNGNLVFSAPIASTTGNKMPVSLSLVYNGYQAGSNINLPSTVGLGWRLNVQAKILAINPTSNTDDLNTKLYNAGYRFLYDDADGTTHYFKETSSGVYQDEDGLGLTVKQISNASPAYEKLEMTSDDGTRLVFTSRGCLREAIDADGNSYKIEYKGSFPEDWKITKITDGAGREFIFTSNTDGQITKITDPAGRNVTFTYSGDLLSRITYPDGTYTEFAYEQNRLVAVHSRNGGWIRYTYHTSGDAAAKSRISKVQEYSIADNGTFSWSNRGSSLQFSFDKLGRTRFTDNQCRTETYIFDNLGRTVNIADANGGTSVYKYEPGSTTNKKANTMLSNTVGKKFVDNLFLNHSFENGLTNWISSGASVNQTEHYLGFKSITLSSNGYVQQRVDKSSGDYNLSAYVKGASSSSKAKMQVEFYNSSNSCIKTYTSKVFTLDSSWQRICCSFTRPASASYMQVRIANAGTEGIYVDCAQVAWGLAVDAYNLVENGGMENTSSSAWIKYKCTDADGYSTGYYGRNMRIFGDCVTKKKIYQTVQINQPAKDLHLTLSAEACATSVPLSNSERKFCLGFTTYFTDGSSVYDYFDFNADCDGVWQHNAGTVGYSGANANKTVQYVNVCLYYDLNANTVYFDNVQLNIDKTGQAYTYDSEGNLISAKDNAGRSETYTYSNAHELTKLKTTDNKEYEFEYPEQEGANKHQLQSATSKSSNIKYSYSYDDAGNLTRQKMQAVDANGNSTGEYISQGYAYDFNASGRMKNNYLFFTTDDRGKNTYYDYDEARGTLQNVTDPNNNTIYYTYSSSNDKLSSVSDSCYSGDPESSTVVYTYTNKGYLYNVSSPSTVYKFDYDAFGNNTSVKVGNRGNYTLTTNTYASNNGNLMRSDYGNGDYVGYIYDNLDRVERKTYNGNDVGRWNYNANGQVGRFEDPVANREYYYYYDDIGRLTRVNIQDTNSSASDFYASFSTDYNTLDQTTGVSYTFDGQTKNVGYTYSSKDYWPLRTTFSGSNKVTNNYDDLGRLTRRACLKGILTQKTVSTNFTYYDYYFFETEPDRTTATVESISYTAVAGGLPLDNRHYTYDNNGNITCERAGTSSSGQIREKYTYDHKNELIRHDSATQKKSFTYEYDVAGNIISKSEYAYTTGTLGAPTNTIEYNYWDSNWGDLMTDRKSTRQNSSHIRRSRMPSSA